MWPLKSLRGVMMEKLTKVPDNIFVTKLEFETSKRFASPITMLPYSFYGDPLGNERNNFLEENRVTAKVTLSIDITTDEDWKFVHALKDKGIQVLLNAGFNVENLRYVINQGMVRLPALLKHEDEEIAKLAWIFSKYFAQRNDIMPEQIVK